MLLNTKHLLRNPSVTYEPSRKHILWVSTVSNIKLRYHCFIRSLFKDGKVYTEQHLKLELV